jgi:peptidoglycan-associated lipoprotein
MIRISRTAPLAIATAIALTACSKHRPETAPAPQEPEASAPAPDTTTRVAASPDTTDQEAARRAERERQMAAARSALTAVIHFDFDRSELTDAARATLDAKLPILRANPAIRLRVAGNTDERGSDEYNLALGQRRAAAAKRYLVQNEIDASRLETMSYGEERPAMQGGSEAAWSQNRRDEFEIIAGGQTITLR